ncbi:MAG: DUF389 domain-containing protein [Candidatus Baltobacteraceae bacterium]
MLSRTRPNLLDLGVALAVGATGSFARVRSSIANTIAGTAIAVALMPPLCVAGIGIAGAHWQISLGAMLLFATNLLGITLASMFVLLLGGYARRRAGPAFTWTAAHTVLIFVPLAISLRTLVPARRFRHQCRHADFAGAARGLSDCGRSGRVFVYQVLVFTGGMGEHAAPIRWEIAQGLAHLGVELDPARNAAGTAVVSGDSSRVVVRVVAADENLMIARHAFPALFGSTAEKALALA